MRRLTTTVLVGCAVAARRLGQPADGVGLQLVATTTADQVAGVDAVFTGTLLSRALEVGAGLVALLAGVLVVRGRSRASRH